MTIPKFQTLHKAIVFIVFIAALILVSEYVAFQTSIVSGSNFTKYLGYFSKGLAIEFVIEFIYFASILTLLLPVLGYRKSLFALLTLSAVVLLIKYLFFRIGHTILSGLALSAALILGAYLQRIAKERRLSGYALWNFISDQIAILWPKRKFGVVELRRIITYTVELRYHQIKFEVDVWVKKIIDAPSPQVGLPFLEGANSYIPQKVFFDITRGAWVAELDSVHQVLNSYDAVERDRKAVIFGGWKYMDEKWGRLNMLFVDEIEAKSGCSLTKKITEEHIQKMAQSGDIRLL